MNTIKVRNLVIGEGKPKICVPIVAVTKEEVIEQAKLLANIPADIVEWRADWFENVFETEKVIDILRELRKVLGEMPILFTFRTKKEGGEKAIDAEQYVCLNKSAAASGYADLIDVEVFSGVKNVKGVIEELQGSQVNVIASSHDFQKTPCKEEIIARLCKMQELGADICKIAVMPQSRRDVITLLAATEEMCTDYADRPMITMSMGELGKVSRVSGEVSGSAVTFGAAGKASAPGQIEVNELKRILNIPYDAD